VGKDGYLTSKEAARILGKSVPWVNDRVKDLISRGEFEGMLSGRQWLISAEVVNRLKTALPPEPEKVVHNYLSNRPPRKHSRGPKSVRRSSNRKRPTSARKAIYKHENLDTLDLRVKNLATLIEVRLAYVVGGKAVWNRLRQDKYGPNEGRRAKLPKKIVGLLEDLRRTKQKYILLRETGRYKRLLRSLPEWDLNRIARAIEALQKNQTQKVAGTLQARPVEGIKGYYSGTGTGKEKRYWWNEED
jgi:hypothetical protein